MLVLAWRLILVLLFGASKDRTYIATDTRIDSILFGCILGVFGNPLLDGTSVGERVWKRLLVPLAVVGLLVSFFVRSPHFQETVRYSLQGACLFPLFVVAVRWPGWLPVRALNIAWVRFLGVLSYSIYLVHPIVLWGVSSRTNAPAVIQAMLGLALTLGISLAIYRLIEKPATQLRRRLSRVDGLPRSSTQSAARRPVLRPAAVAGPEVAEP
jgi:peptidoglycan/LPS O-acetylase OafA/YrhL